MSKCNKQERVFQLTDNDRKKYKNLELLDLIKKCQQDDRIALEELIRRNQKNVFSAFYHLDPAREDLSDLVQEALFRMARSIKKLKNPARFKFWLNQIITNLFYDDLRKKTRRISTVSFDYSNLETDEEKQMSRDLVDPGIMPHDKSLGRELDKIIKKAIEELPEQFRIVIVMRELQGLTYDEIAIITNTNVGTVKSRLSRARNKLQEIIKPYLG
ncbi:MAG: sigma-70 family RNA polymerase sigma factor [Candidatus Gastranaerophilaceae bacterium]